MKKLLQVKDHTYNELNPKHMNVVPRSTENTNGETEN